MIRLRPYVLKFMLKATAVQSFPLNEATHLQGSVRKSWCTLEVVRSCVTLVVPPLMEDFHPVVIDLTPDTFGTSSLFLPWPVLRFSLRYRCSGSGQLTPDALLLLWLSLRLSAAFPHRGRTSLLRNHTGKVVPPK